MNGRGANPTSQSPDLRAEDIPFGRGGLSVGVIEVGNEASYREVAQEAIHALAGVTKQHERARAVIGRLREELRVTRRGLAA